MIFEWDDRKAAENLRNHGVSFEQAHLFEFEDAAVFIDDREAYGEERMVAYGFIGNRVHVLVYTERAGAVRVISLRRANKREIRDYEEGRF